MTGKEFIGVIQAELEPLADRSNAKAMSAYMKHHFDFLGIPSPIRKAATKQIVRAQKENILQSAQALWKLPAREYQYVACELLARNVSSLGPNDLEKLLELVCKKSWWDSVDSLHTPIGAVVLNHQQLAKTMLELSLHKNMWLRRTAIIHQLGYGKQTDLELLFRICLDNAADKEFFIRKAIGWALREHARHEPSIVQEFLRTHAHNFSGLTVREASKHL